MAQVDRYLTELVNRGGSDLHLSSCTEPRARVHGKMEALEDRKLSPEELQKLVEEVMPPDALARFQECCDADFAYAVPGLGRFRGNGFMDRHGAAAVFRHVPEEVPTLAQLNLPDVVGSFANLSRGLVLVTGPTGSGKSTTLAAVVNQVNSSRSCHIITIEDPIEFVYENDQALINQREVGTHTRSFATGLRAALREDPDVLLVGEMRDLETTGMAIESAETGHLVLATLHTSSAPSTVDRIIDQFPGDQQSQIRTMLGESLQAIVSQVLLRRKGGGRIAALEILVANRAISSMIREGKTHQIASAMQTGRRLGMTTLNDAIVKLVSRGDVEPEEGYMKAADKESLLQCYEVAGIRYLPPSNRTRPSKLRDAVGMGG